MLNARRLRFLLEHARSTYAHRWLEGTRIEDTGETNDIDAPYTDDDEVIVTFSNGDMYRLILEKVN